MKKPRLYVVGTNHMNPRSRTRVEHAIVKYKPTIIYSEGVGIADALGDAYLWMRNFPLMIGLKIWQLLLSLGPEEFIFAEQIANEHKIKFKCIDTPVAEQMHYFARWWNSVIFGSLVILSLFLCVYLPHWLWIFEWSAFAVLFCLFYFLYFALYTKSLRDKNFIMHLQKYCRKYPRGKPMFLCGNRHVRMLKTSFEIVLAQ